MTLRRVPLQLETVTSLPVLSAEKPTALPSMCVHVWMCVCACVHVCMHIICVLHAFKSQPKDELRALCVPATTCTYGRDFSPAWWLLTLSWQSSSPSLESLDAQICIKFTIHRTTGKYTHMAQTFGYYKYLLYYNTDEEIKGMECQCSAASGCLQLGQVTCLKHTLSYKQMPH